MARLPASATRRKGRNGSRGHEDLLTAHLGIPAEGMGQLIMAIYTQSPRPPPRPPGDPSPFSVPLRLP